jgi:hypothetical protein
LYKELAKNFSMPFINFQKVKQIYAEEQRGKLITVLPYAIISKYKVIPLEVKGKIMDVAVDNPLDRKFLVAIKYLFGQYTLNIFVVSTQSIDWAIDHIYNEIHKKNAMLDLYNRTPNQSAYRVLLPKQKFTILAIIAALAGAIVIDSVVTFMALFSAISILYFI